MEQYKNSIQSRNSINYFRKAVLQSFTVPKDKKKIPEKCLDISVLCHRGMGGEGVVMAPMRVSSRNINDPHLDLLQDPRQGLFIDASESRLLTPVSVPLVLPPRLGERRT